MLHFKRIRVNGSYQGLGKKEHGELVINRHTVSVKQNMYDPLSHQYFRNLKSQTLYQVIFITIS